VESWQDHDVTVKVEVSTAGDLIDPSTSTSYPFTYGGAPSGPTNNFQYCADGWTFFADSGGFVGDMNYQVRSGTQLLQNSVSVPNTAKRYGFSRYFPAVPNMVYVLGVEVRTLPGIYFLPSPGNSPNQFAYARLEAHVTWYNGATVIREANRYIVIEPTPAADGPYAKCQLVTEAAPAGTTQILVQILGRASSTNTASLWAIQIANLWISEYNPAARPALVWRDITCDVVSTRTRYGRARYTERYDVATAAIVVRNEDGDYAYANPHPFNLRPGRVIRVTAVYQGANYPLFWGLIDSIVEGYQIDGHVTNVINCVDPTSLLSMSQIPVTASGANIYSGTRITELLNLAHYPWTAIQAGQWLTNPVRSTGRTLREEAGVTADSEGGQFYASRTGYLTYEDRATKTYPDEANKVTAQIVSGPYTKPLPIPDNVPTLATAPIIEPRQLTTDWSASKIVNRLTLAVVGGTAKQCDDISSQSDYGIRTYQRTDLECLENSNGTDTLAALANDLMNGRSDAVLRVDSVTFIPMASPEGASNQYPWRWALSAFLNWLVRVWYVNDRTGWGYVAVTRIQSVEHAIGLSNWETTLSIDQPLTFVSFWLSNYGWDKGKWDTNKWDDKTYD
jgi:hypothetical protein